MKYTSLGVYAKAISAAVAAALFAAITALSDNLGVSTSEALIIAGAFLTGLVGVWAVPNLPEGIRKYGKAITAGLVALVASLAVGFTDGGLTSTELINAALALLGGLGLITITPNSHWSDVLHESPQPEDYDLPDVDSFHTVTLTNDEDGDFRDDETGRFLPRA